LDSYDIWYHIPPFFATKKVVKKGGQGVLALTVDTLRARKGRKNKYD